MGDVTDCHDPNKKNSDACCKNNNALSLFSKANVKFYYIRVFSQRHRE